MIINKFWGTENILYSRGNFVVKEITADEDLSIQSHADKVETFTAINVSCIYVMTEAGIIDYVNSFKHIQDFADDIHNGNIVQKMGRVVLHSGESYSIQKDWLHYIAKGSHVIETSYGLQETMRIYDWNRQLEQRPCNPIYYYKRYHK